MITFGILFALKSSIRSFGHFVGKRQLTGTLIFVFTQFPFTNFSTLNGDKSVSHPIGQLTCGILIGRLLISSDVTGIPSQIGLSERLVRRVWIPGYLKAFPFDLII